MKIRKKRCKSFGAGFLVVGHNAIGGRNNFSDFSKTFFSFGAEGWQYPKSYFNAPIDIHA